MPFIFDISKRLKTTFAPLLIGLSAAVLGGCTTPRKEAKPIAPETTKAVEVTTKQQKAAERAFDDRVKALARFAAGLSSQHKQEHDEALDHFFKSIKADPSNQSLALTVARRLLQKQKVDDAVEVLEKVRQTKDSPGTIDALLGVAYRQKKELEKAAAASAAAIRKSPGFILGYRTLFQLHTTAREPAAALAVLKQAAAVEKPATIFLIEVAELLTAHLRAHPESLAAERPTLLGLVKQIEDRDSKLPLVLERLAQMYEFAGNPLKSESILKGLIARDPNGLKFHRDLFNLHLRTNNRPAAIRELEGLLSLQPTNADFNFFRGALAAEDDDWEKAENYYGKALQFNEQHPQAYYSLTGVHLSQDKPDAALEVLARARKKFKATFSLEYYSALAYSRKKDFAKSVRHYTAAEIVAKQDDPARLDHLFYFQMAATYERNKDFARATQIFRKVLAMKPDFPDAMNYLGYMWAERGENLPEARELIQKAVAAEPDNAAYLDSMGWVLYMSGKQRESIPWLLRAVELSDEATEKDSTLFSHLGDAYFAIGDYRNARIQFLKAVKIEPKPELKRKLAESIRLAGP